MRAAAAAVDAAERRIAEVRRNGGGGGAGRRERKRGKEERWGGESGREKGETRRKRGREEVRKTRAFGSEEVDGAGRRGGGDGWTGKREGGRELDVRTNAICMILHVLARPGAAPIGFQLSAYVFCLLFWLYGMAGTRGGRIGRVARTRATRRSETERERLPREIAGRRCDAKGNYFAWFFST